MSKIAVFGLFFKYGTHQILVRIPEISRIACFNSCEQVAAIGDEFEIKILHVDQDRQEISGGLIQVYPENNPWDETWQIKVGDEIDATVIRRVEMSDCCDDGSGWLLALRPGALVILCGHEAARFKRGDKCSVRIISVCYQRRKVNVEYVG